METLNMKDNRLLRWWKPSRVGPRRRGAAFFLLPNQSRHAEAGLAADSVDGVVRREE